MSAGTLRVTTPIPLRRDRAATAETLHKMLHAARRDDDLRSDDLERRLTDALAAVHAFDARAVEVGRDY